MKDRIRYIPGPTRLLLVLLAFLACAGCSLVNHQPAAQPQPAIAILDAANTGNFGPRPALPTPEDIHRLDPEQIQHFLDYLHDPANAATSEHFRVGHYLQQITARFQYEGRTFDAASTLALKSGNCMSLAILTTALAEIAGLEIDYELMDDVPVFEFNETAIIKGVHIRSIIFDPAYSTDETRFTLTRPGVKIDYFPTNRQRFIGNMDRPVYLAMIYQNLSVEALENGDMDLAYWLALEALTHAGNYGPAINQLAVINRRAGDIVTAEFIYKYGIEHADDKLSLLKNYRLLLEAGGRYREALAIQQQLDTIEDPSPFHWFQLGRTSYAAGEFSEAIVYYNRALKQAPYLHEAWFGIAQANYEMGRFGRTRLALQSAFQEAGKVSIRNLYEAKLMALQQHQATY